MTPETLQAIQSALASQPDSTHYEGCWEYHGWCAVAYLLADIAPLEPCDHVGRSTIARLVDLGLPCPECGVEL